MSAHETWRVVCQGGEVREVAVTHDGRLWRAQVRHASGTVVADEMAATPRQAVACLCGKWAWPVVEILVPGEVSRAELMATIDALRANTAALGEEVASLEAARAEVAEVAELRAAVRAYLSIAEERANDLSFSVAIYQRERAARAALDALLAEKETP